jgi:ribose transport system permease protein
MSDTPVSNRSGRRGRFLPSAFFETYGSLLALALLIFVGCLIPDFARFQNFTNIIRQSSVVGVIAVGMTFVIILGGIDLSVGAMVALLGGLGFWVMEMASQSGVSPAWCVAWGALVMLLGGPLLGLSNGLLITKGRVTPFVATLGAMAAFRSLCLTVADGGEYRAPAGLTFNPIQRVFRPFADAMDWFTTKIGFQTPGEPGFFSAGVPVYHLSIVFVLVAVIAHLMLRKSTFGYYVRAVGDNTTAATYSAVRVDRVKVLTYALSGLVCGIAAVMVSSRLNSVSSSQTGNLYELDAIAAVVVGGTRMTGGAGRVWSTVVGVLILGVISNLLNMINPDWLANIGKWLGFTWLHLERVNMTHLQGFVKGTIIVAAVLLQRSSKK